MGFAIGPEIVRLRGVLYELFPKRIVSGRDVVDAVLGIAVESFATLRLEQLRYELRLEPNSRQSAQGSMIDLFRREAHRQAGVCIEIVDATLGTPGLFSEDPRYPGITRSWLEDFRRTLEGEVAKLDANQATIAVIGTVKSGKSTTINAVVGSEVVPARDHPMTTFPTRVIHRQGQVEPLLTFPLHERFEELARAVGDEVIRRKRNDPRAFGALMGRAPQREDLDRLVAQIETGRLAIGRYTKGPAAIQLLVNINDLTRLAEHLGISLENVAADKMTFEETPSLEVEFEHLMSGANAYSGALALVDTPGPDEAGQGGRLAPVVKQQLEDATAIILVVRYSHLGAEATERLEVLLEALPPGAAKRLFIFVNHYDVRAQEGDDLDLIADFEMAERRRRDDLRHTAAQRVAERIDSTDPDTLIRHVFPTSARYALRANQAKRAKRTGSPLSPSDAWVRDFAARAFGETWQRDRAKLADLDEIEKGIQVLQEASLFSEPLDDVIRASAKEASKLLVESCLDKLSAKGTPLFNMFGIRDGIFVASIEDLQTLMRELQADLDALEQAHQANETSMLAMFAELRADTSRYVDDIVDSVAAVIETYIKTGSPEKAAAESLQHTERTSKKRGRIQRIKDFGKKIAQIFTGDAAEASIDPFAQRSATSKAPSFVSSIDDKTMETRIQLSSRREAEEMVKAIFLNVDAVYDNGISEMITTVRAEFESFAYRVRLNVKTSLERNWLHFQDRIRDLLDVTLAPPQYDVTLELTVDETRRAHAVGSEERIKEKTVPREGEAFERALGGALSVFGFKTSHWGWKTVVDRYDVYHVDVGKIREQIAERRGQIKERIDVALRNAQGELGLELEHYNKTLQDQIAAAREYARDEQVLRAADAETYAALRARVSALANQARDLVTDALTLKAAIGSGDA